LLVNVIKQKRKENDMKKLLSIAIVLTIVLSLVISFVAPVSAAKPVGNTAGAVKYGWHLSGAVMPVPPYGSIDIPGSDTASKLIVNQPMGTTQVAITGVMNGLNPNTTYTVYLSKGYTPYVFTGWNVAGTYTVNVEYLGNNYPETLILTQSGNTINGVSLDTVPPGSFFGIFDGTVTGNQVTIHSNNGALYTDLVGTIASDGSISGNWSDVTGQLSFRTGTWASTSGAAVKNYTGDTGWPGLFASTIQPFTFVTDAYGAGSWHVNVKDADLVASGSAPYKLSVWINVGGTILISDNFLVVSN
jgi:hypothetical protein